MRTAMHRDSAGSAPPTYRASSAMGASLSAFALLGCVRGTAVQAPRADDRLRPLSMQTQSHWYPAYRSRRALPQLFAEGVRVLRQLAQAPMQLVALVAQLGELVAQVRHFGRDVVAGMLLRSSPPPNGGTACYEHRAVSTLRNTRPRAAHLERRLHPAELRTQFACLVLGGNQARLELPSPVHVATTGDRGGRQMSR